MKPISIVTTFLVPLLFVFGVVVAPPAGAEAAAPEPVLGACTGSVCPPSLSDLLRRAPRPFRQSGRAAGGHDRLETTSAEPASRPETDFPVRRE